MDDLTISYRSLSGLIPYARNARLHTDEQVAQIAASIREFGFNNPILIDSDSTIIAGHGRVMAAHLLGIETVPVVELNHLTETQKRAYTLADNKLTDNSSWSDEMLSLELEDLINDIDLSVIGFSEEELKGIMGSFDPGSEDDQGRLDKLDPQPVECPACGEVFDAREAKVKD